MNTYTYDIDDDDLETDIPIMTTGFTGTVNAVLEEDGADHVVLFGRENSGKPAVLKVRLAAHQDAIAFYPGRTVRVVELIGKMGRELMLAFPATDPRNIQNDIQA